MTVQKFASNETFVVTRQTGAGSQSSHIRLVLSGEVNVHLMGEAKQHAALSWRVGEGACLGLLSSFAPLAQTYGVEAVGQVVCAAIGRDDLRQLLETEPAAAGKFMASLVAELAIASAEFLSKVVVMDKLSRGMRSELEASGLREVGQAQECERLRQAAAAAQLPLGSYVLK
jgi:CRP-like cAMP-binding protein